MFIYKQLKKRGYEFEIKQETEYMGGILRRKEKGKI